MLQCLFIFLHSKRILRRSPVLTPAVAFEATHSSRNAEGEFVTLLGRSGSGKSTLLNLVSGIDRPDGGEVNIIAEHVITTLSE